MIRSETLANIRYDIKTNQNEMKLADFYVRTIAPSMQCFEVGIFPSRFPSNLTLQAILSVVLRAFCFVHGCTPSRNVVTAIAQMIIVAVI